MNRRHQSFQTYDYDRFGTHVQPQGHTRETIKPRERARDAAIHGTIQYQDDSPISSDEDSYLTQSQHHRDRKDMKDYHNSKQESSVKTTKPEKSQGETYSAHVNNKDFKADETNSTTDRLGRLEKMLEQLIKRESESTASLVAPPAPTIVLPDNSLNKRGANQYALEPRRFDFTTSMWMNRIQEVSVQNNWHEKSIISYMETQMSGIIKAWYKNLTSYDYTWPELKIMITRMFPDNVDFITTLKRLVTRLRQADESIVTYYFSKMYLIEACKITGPDAVSCLIDGLNNQDIQERAKSRNFLTPESLYSQFLLNLPDYSVDYSPLSSHADLPSQPAATGLSGKESRQHDSWHYEQPQQQSRRERDRDERSEAYRERHQDLESSADFNYEHQPMEDSYSYHNEEHDNEIHSLSTTKSQGTVHSRLDKRFIRPTKPKIPLAAKYCNICKNRGHIARNCSFKKQRNAVLVCRFAENISKKCYFQKCYINSEKVQGFIDTGCTRTLIKESTAKELNLDIISTNDMIEIYGGGSILAKGRARFLLQLNSLHEIVDSLVVPDRYQDVSVIIGQEFLNRKDAILTIHDDLLQVMRI